MVIFKSYGLVDPRLSHCDPYSETTTFEYDIASRLTQKTFASGAYDVTGYDSRNRTTSVTHKNSSGTVLSSETYSLDSASNLSSKTVDSLTTSYTYDAANQILSESNTGYSASYSYDSNGNRSSQVLNGTTYSYSYDSGDKLTSVSSGGSTVKSYGYDGAGRTHTVTTSAGTTTLTYDYEDRVTGISYPSSATNSFTYNGLDTRVGKVDSSGTSTYKRDGADVTDPVLSDGSIAYTPGTSERKSGASTFDHANYLGTINRQTNSSQATTATRVYDAFGNLESTTGVPQSPFGFVGDNHYQEDGDSGLKLLGHRYLDSSTGRYLSRDPIQDGRNWYSYCSNAPTANVDPDGYQDHGGGGRGGGGGRRGGDKGRGDDPRYQRNPDDLKGKGKNQDPTNDTIRKHQGSKNAKKRKENYMESDPVNVPAYNPNHRAEAWLQAAEGVAGIIIILAPEVGLPALGVAYVWALF